MKLSILIPTLPERKPLLDKLLVELERQRKQFGREAEVEICTLTDNRTQTTGAKRNTLVQNARGLFCSFVDDDDWVSDTYIYDILQVIDTCPSIDCIGFYGEVQWPGGAKKRMGHSLVFHTNTEVKGVYYRIVNHINPVRTTLARQVPYPNVSVYEDSGWASAMQHVKLLRREVFLGHKPLYYYRIRG